MLSIRPEQFQQFSRKSEQDFLLRMQQHIRAVFADEISGWRQVQLAITAEKLVEQARSHDICAANDICDYISVCFVLGMIEGDMPVSVQETLQDPHLSGSARIMLIKQQIREGVTDV